MKVRGIHHVGLVVDDLDAAVAFYSTLLNMEVVEQDHWRSPAPLEDQAVGLTGSSADGVMLRGAGAYLELWHYAAPAQVGQDPEQLGANERGLRHLAVEVDEVTAMLEHVVELGGRCMGDPVRLDGSGAQVVYCRDPFGTILELMSTGSTLASIDDL